MGGALSAGVNVDFAVLPVSHRAAGLEGLMAYVGRDERFVQHERGIFEACVEVAVGPIVPSLTHRQPPVLSLGKIRLGPLELGDLGG